MALIDKLTAIADAIRGKTGGTEKLTMDQMAEEVGGLSAGGPLQAKTACPSHSEQVIAPDEGYYGLKTVTVKAVPRLPFATSSFGEGLTFITQENINIVMQVGAVSSVMTEESVK